MPNDPQLKADLDYILQQALDASTVLDELAIIRVALRHYADHGNAQDAVAFAAWKISDSLTSNSST